MTRVSLFAPIFFASSLLAQPTYYGGVDKIFREKCETCHHEGDIAPFALSTYDNAVEYARDIRRVVDSGKMPPWKPVAGHGDFKGVRALSTEERQMILDWVAADTPAGDEANKLPEPGFKGEWSLGYPDKVLSMIESYEPPVGQDVYRCFVIPTEFAETRYLKGVDYLPGDRGIVHHILLYSDTTGIGDRLDAQDPGPGYSCFGGPGIDLSINSLKSLIGGWAPGQRPSLMGEEVGVEVPKGAKLIMQVHYFPMARTGLDQTRVGFYFHEKKPKNTMFMIPVLNDNLNIPAGAESHTEQAIFPTGSLATLLNLINLIEPTKIINVYPHMHLLGRQINAELVDATGKTVQPLVYIDNWDFNWQGAYDYVAPVQMKAGQRVKLTCTYDNSSKNPFNPNFPLVPVKWGERTTDEMCLVFIGVYSSALENALGLLN